MIKVNYDTESTLVKGYYPSSINYASIPEPYIEISDEKHQEALGKQMCVTNGIFQEYVLTPAKQLEQAKLIRVATRLFYLQETDWQASAFIKYQRPIDNGVSEKCQLANNEMASIEACLTLEEVEQYSINF